MATICEQLLPSGRAVRYEVIRPEEWLAINERIAIEIGDSPDPGRARFLKRLQTELVCSCLKEITRISVEPTYIAGKPDEHDVDRMLDSIEPQSWVPLSNERLKTPGDTHVFTLFDEMEDWAAIQAYVQGEGRREKNPYARKRRIRSS
jgi:hypothetical protein